MIDGMTNARLTDSISPNFIVQMIPHHQGAICISKNASQFAYALRSNFNIPFAS